MAKIEYKENIRATLDGLTSKEIYRSMANAVRATGRTGVREIKSAYKKTGIKHRADSKYGNPSAGVRSRALKNPLFLSLSIMGDFRLKWFEKGTQERRTKKGYARGKITATPFFSPTMQSIKPRIVEVFEKAYHDAVKRLVNKRVKS
jgi:hypothetical protein